MQNVCAVIFPRQDPPGLASRNRNGRRDDDELDLFRKLCLECDHTVDVIAQGEYQSAQTGRGSIIYMSFDFLQPPPLLLDRPLPTCHPVDVNQFALSPRRE